jgi:hypothetical protein
VDGSARGCHTIRTEVTVQHEALTLLVDDADAVADFDACPLCGNKLDPEQAEKLRLPKGPISA